MQYIYIPRTRKFFLFLNVFRAKPNSVNQLVNYICIGELQGPDISISELDVFNALSSLDPTKAMGIDGIGPKIHSPPVYAQLLPAPHSC